MAQCMVVEAVRKAWTTSTARCRWVSAEAMLSVSQAEVNKLSAQLAKTQAESKQWREAAESADRSSGSAAFSSRITELTETHREEMAALQLAHARAMEAFREQLAQHAPTGTEDDIQEEEPAAPAPAPAPEDGGEPSPLLRVLHDMVAALQPLAQMADAPPLPVDGLDGAGKGESVVLAVRDVAARLAAKYAADTLHMDCELRAAAAAQARDALQHQLATAREEQGQQQRAHEHALEAVQQQLAASQSSLDTLRARMLVDAQDLAAIEGQLEASVAREAAQQQTIQQLRGELTSTSDQAAVKASVSHEELAQITSDRDKAMAQLESLRLHLLQREAAYTEDAQRRDNQITYMQQQLREARGERDSIASSLQAQLSAAMSSIDALRNDATRLTAERNMARSDAAAKLAECNRLGQATANLESVLAAFEADREASLAAARAEMEAQAEEHKHATAQVEAALKEAQRQLAVQATELRELARVKGELNVARGLQMAATTQAQALQAQMNEANARLHAALRSADENLIDRRLVSNAVISYFTAPSHRREDVLQLLASMLGLSEADQSKIGLHKRSFLKNLFTPPQPPPTTSPAAPFGEEFVNFLLHEAHAPTPEATPTKLFPETTPVAAIRPNKPPSSTPSVSSIPTPSGSPPASALPSANSSLLTGPEPPAAPDTKPLSLDAIISDGVHTVSKS